MPSGKFGNRQYIKAAGSNTHYNGVLTKVEFKPFILQKTLERERATIRGWFTSARVYSLFGSCVIIAGL